MLLVRAVRLSTLSTIILWGTLARAQTAGHVVTIAPNAFGVSPPLAEVLATPALVDAVSADPAVVNTGGTVNHLNFDGIPDAPYIYPDSNGAVGATQYVQWANTRFEVFSKASGKKLLGPMAARLLWKPLGLNHPCYTTSAGDGIVNYDKAAQRWVISRHTNGGSPYLQCVAVSTTSDATQSYYVYSFSLTSAYPDYPQLGIWPDAYYLTANLLKVPGFTNIAAQVCALDRASMLAGRAAATAQCAQTVTSTKYSVLQPSDADGTKAPPAGSPNYLLALANNSLDLYKFHVDWTTPANSSLSGPFNIPVQPFTQACGGGLCVPQLGTTQVLDGVGDRLLHRVAYRMAPSYDVLLVTHSVAAGASVGVRWYEIRHPGTTPVVFQQGTIAPDSLYRWLGSPGMDHVGNIVVGYSLSGTSLYPSIRYAGRMPGDPAGSLGPEVDVFDGTGAQTAGGNNWGNASSLSIDPVDDCTFWYTNEYLSATGQAWSTRVANFKFATCH